MTLTTNIIGTTNLMEEIKISKDNKYCNPVILSVSSSEVYGDGYKGVPQFAPYDKIIITCGAPFIPDDLVTQLKIGGLMVAPIGEGDIQIMNLIERISENEKKITKHGKFSFVPMLSDTY